MDQIFMWAIGIFMAIIVSLVGFIVTFILQSQKIADAKAEKALADLKIEFHLYKVEMSTSVSLIKKDQDEIRFNYLKRFEGVNANIYIVKEEIVGKIHELHSAIIENKKV